MGQFFCPAAFINDSDAEIQKLENLIKDYHIGVLTFFHSRISAASNFEGKRKVIRNENSYQRLQELINHYQSIAPTPLLISIDAEWGLAMRVENTPQYPYALTLGAIPEDQNELIHQVGNAIGNDLKSIGIHMNLAPVVDINMNPDNPVIGYRSFGQDKEQVIKRALLYYQGLKASGTLGCFKHFPGHGDTNIDSHLGLPLISKTKEELYNQELYPFIKAIEQEVDSIMIGHLAVPSLSNDKNTSATLSKDIIKEVLRKELGFKGVVISDALNMHSVSKLYDEKGMLEWKAFDAGNDILCFAEHVEEGINMIEKNASDHQIEESILRIQKLKEHAFSQKKENNDGGIDHTTLNLKIAETAITMYKSDPESFKNYNTGEFEAICIGKNNDCHFYNEIQKQRPSINMVSDTKTDLTTDHILIALFPPSIKPLNNFGINEETKQFIAQLSKVKNVTLYLFGNPYALRVLSTDYIKNIVLCYQDLESFQRAAAQHFLGNHKAIGKIPVQLL
ncbi:glycoside hydrolase family 3 N-terminal domain-containing protein [Aquimarina sp. MMG016]|uniref:glycoside hydrolase family 3 protein n=1 Tax=Aquimarina sp. MMG016 TaxID=2822690 RepID=UPI0032B58340